MTLACACGCNKPRHGRSLYASDACRARAWRARVNYGPQKPRKSRSNGNTRRSGRQASYRKAVDGVTALLRDHYGVDAEDAHLIAEVTLTPALPRNQR